jgi:hypothetical protein
MNDITAELHEWFQPCILQKRVICVSERFRNQNPGLSVPQKPNGVVGAKVVDQLGYIIVCT